MTSENIISQAHEKMVKTVDHTLHEFSSLHTGKASPTLLDGVQVSVEAYGGSASPVKDLAAISAPDIRTISIQAWDKSTVSDIKKAIEKANLGFTPVVDGNLIRISIPELSGERRRELVKVANNIAEEGRIRVRQARREAMDALKQEQKQGAISEDDLKRHEKAVQAETDRNIQSIDEHLEHKEKELTTV